jgi:hypothetical protein
MAELASRNMNRDELILNNAGDMNRRDLARLVFDTTGEYVTENAVNIVMVRARNAGDPRVPRRKSKRGTKSDSPFNKGPFAREGKVLPFRVPQPPVENEGKLLHEAMETNGALPSTSRLFINTKARHCRFPLRGSGIELIVCGANVDSRPPYCPVCRDRAYLKLT